jgi:hypothetical protein
MGNVSLSCSIGDGERERAVEALLEMNDSGGMAEE